MVDKFHVFAKAVRQRFDELSQDKLFVVNSDRDAIWDRYLSAFPQGSNPIFRKRTEHDCSCCRAFIRQVGNIVAIQNGALSSVWDLNGLPESYQVVADSMSEYVKSLPISDVYLTKFAKHGTAVSHELTESNGTLTWSHFAIDVPRKFVEAAKLDERRGELRTTFQVLKRGLLELKPEAIATVADLIAENAIYRGAEHQRAVLEFQQLQARVLGTADPSAMDQLIWLSIESPVARFRNTVIGTLVQDLSDDVDIETAVKSFETKVAPQNYKRPTALITKSMVEQAMKTINDLGLDQALERRHAKFSDVSVNSVLFVDNAVRGQMKGGIEGLLMQEVKPAKFDPKKAEEIGIEEFVEKVIPKSSSLSLFLDNGLLGNFVSMTAPIHEDSKSLFKWDNDFAWSYDGNVTDTIKERVKRAGGMVEGVLLRVSLAWFNYDDLDLHCRTAQGYHVYYGDKRAILDVDMNAGGRHQSREAVENMRWQGLPKDGTYHFWVNQFSRQESIDVGFVVEIETMRGIETLRYERAVVGDVLVCDIVITHGKIEVKPAPSMIAGSISQERWGLKTIDLVRVNSVVLSPNYWDDNAVGNKHWFFILEGCKNPLPTRGIYNEFLSSNLEKHRKVFEVLGDKTKCQPTDNQMSGVGFSSTRKDKVTVVATGHNLNKAYTIVF